MRYFGCPTWQHELILFKLSGLSDSKSYSESYRHGNKESALLPRFSVYLPTADLTVWVFWYAAFSAGLFCSTYRSLNQAERGLSPSNSSGFLSPRPSEIHPDTVYSSRWQQSFARSRLVSILPCRPLAGVSVYWLARSLPLLFLCSEKGNKTSHQSSELFNLW